MSRSHIKRLVMPRSWPLPRKSSIWVQKPNAGGLGFGLYGVDLILLC